MQNNAFSLVELSIVLVILGLLTGGILTGQSLIKAAEMRSVSTEAEQFAAAVNTFKGKYFALPGDMTNATQFWGKLSAYCNVASGTANAAGTCNGDGDGVIDNNTAASQPGEIFLFWNQLALAGLIEGQYSGLAGPAGIWDALYNVNVPSSKYSSAGWMVIMGDYLSGDSFLFAKLHVNSFILGADSNNAVGAGWTGNPLLIPEDAWNIDKKMDDGKPAYGNVIAMNWPQCAVANSGVLSSTNFDALYNLSNTGKVCSFVFNNMF